MIDDRDESTSARLARASQQLSILAHELRITLAEAGGRPLDPEMLSWISSRLSNEALDVAELTFAVAEDAVAASGDQRAERSAAALGRIARIIEPVFEVASELAAHTLVCVNRAEHAQQPITAETLSALDEPIIRLLTDNRSLITGAGVATAPDALADRHLWMQWWIQGSDGLEQIHPQLDEKAPHFYDYPAAVWFTESARDLAPHLAPPHFDDGGTDTWMITAAVPILTHGRLLGLACAEITLERVGELVAPTLQALPMPAALVSPEGLVVASAHPRMQPGDPVAELAHQAVGEASTFFAEHSPDVTIARSPALSWRIVVDWAD